MMHAHIYSYFGYERYKQPTIGEFEKAIPYEQYKYVDSGAH